MRIMYVTLHLISKPKCPTQGTSANLRLKSLQIKIRDTAQIDTFVYFNVYWAQMCYFVLYILSDFMVKP